MQVQFHRKIKGSIKRTLRHRNGETAHSLRWSKDLKGLSSIKIIQCQASDILLRVPQCYFGTVGFMLSLSLFVPHDVLQFNVGHFKKNFFSLSSPL